MRCCGLFVRKTARCSLSLLFGSVFAELGGDNRYSLLTNHLELAAKGKHEGLNQVLSLMKMTFCHICPLLCKDTNSLLCSSFALVVGVNGLQRNAPLHTHLSRRSRTTLNSRARSLNLRCEAPQFS